MGAQTEAHEHQDHQGPEPVIPHAERACDDRGAGFGGPSRLVAVKSRSGAGPYVLGRLAPGGSGGPVEARAFRGERLGLTAGTKGNQLFGG